MGEVFFSTEVSFSCFVLIVYVDLERFISNDDALKVVWNKKRSSQTALVILYIHALIGNLIKRQILFREG